MNLKNGYDDAVDNWIIPRSIHQNPPRNPMAARVLVRSYPEPAGGDGQVRSVAIAGLQDGIKSRSRTRPTAERRWCS
jgi:hypothetical protein